MARLAVVVPLVIGLIFLLLAITFGYLRQAVLILLAIPFAMVGGLPALWPHRSVSLGLVSSTILTLIVLPVLYRWIERRFERETEFRAPFSAKRTVPNPTAD